MSTVLQTTESQGKIWQCRQQVRRRLAGVRRAMRAHLFWDGMAWMAGTCVALAGASLLIDRLLRPEVPSRLAMLGLEIAVIGTIAWRRLVRPLRYRLDDLDLAELLDRRRPGVGQRLTNVLQLPGLLERGKVDGSPAMIEAAVLDDASALEEIDLKETLNVSRRRKLVSVWIGAVALAVLFYYLFPSLTGVWTKRWFAGSDERWPQRTYLSVLGLNDQGKFLVPRGEATILEVDAQPEFAPVEGGWRVPGRSDTFIIPGSSKPHSDIPESVSIEYRSAGGAGKRGIFTHYEAGRFRYELPPLVERATFSLRGGDDWTGTMQIEPIDRPAIRDLTITAWIPGRSEPEIHHAGRDDSQLLFLPTTRLELALESDQPLSAARIVTQADDGPPLEQIDPMHYRAKWKLKISTTLEFQLTGQRAGLTSKPFFLTIGLLIDRPPRVGIRLSGVGRRVTPQARLPLAIHAVDDFGIAEIFSDVEHTQLVDSKPQSSMHQPYAEKPAAKGEIPPTDTETQTTIKLLGLNVAAGNTIRIRGRATDTNVLGAQDGVSRWLMLQVVTPEELFYEILTRQREQRARFRKALDLAKGQMETIQKVSQSDGAASLSRVHQVVARQVGQISSQLDATLQEMINNDLSSPQARDLLESAILAPLRKLHDEAFAEVGQKIQSLLANPDLREADRQDLLAAQQAVVSQMQKILAQMSQWESFVDVISQLRQIIKSENDLLEATKKVLKERIQGTFD